MDELRQRLCDFRMHEETPVESIIAPHGLEILFREIDSLLESNNADAIVHVLGFIRDAGLYEHQFRDGFRAHLKSSNIWASSRRLLLYPNFYVRKNTVYTIGKLTCRDQSHLLTEAFPFFLQNDPINLPELLLELVWLTNEWPWSFLDRVASANHYLRRWSLCRILNDNGGAPDTLHRFERLLETLKDDVDHRVAVEANLRLERIRVKFGSKLPKAEWRKEVKRIKDLEPKVTFEHAAMQFMLHRDDYSLDEFQRFVDELE